MKKYFYIIILIIIFSVILLMFNGNIFNIHGINENFTDFGTSNNNSNEWYILPNVTKSVLNNGTVIHSKSDQGAYANKPNTDKNGWKDLYDWSSPFVVEFDVLEWSGAPYIRITNETNDASQSFSALKINNGSHVKIVSKNESVTYIVDEKSVVSINKKLTNAQIGFRLDNASVMYRNFTIYPE